MSGISWVFWHFRATSADVFESRGAGCVRVDGGFISVDGCDPIRQRWAVSVNGFEWKAAGQSVGVVADWQMSSVGELAPVNPNTGRPYFRAAPGRFPLVNAGPGVFEFWTDGRNAGEWLSAAERAEQVMARADGEAVLTPFQAGQAQAMRAGSVGVDTTASGMDVFVEIGAPGGVSVSVSNVQPADLQSVLSAVRSTFLANLG